MSDATTNESPAGEIATQTAQRPTPLAYEPAGVPTPAPTPAPTRAYVQLFLGGVLDAAGEVLLKVGANHAAASHYHLPEALSGLLVLLSVWTWVGIVCYVTGLLCWLYVLRFIPLIIAFPVVCVLHTLAPLAAQVLLHEHVSLTRWLGIGIAMAGVLLILKPLEAAEKRL